MSSILQLLDIPKFIEENKLRPVTSPEIFLPGTNTFHPDGVYSEEIFGKLGTKRREETFSYIDLKKKYIHPEAIDIVKFFIPKLKSVIAGKTYIFVNKTKTISVYSEDETKEKPDKLYTGIRGIIDLFKENWDILNWDKYSKKDERYVRFIQKYKDRVFIDKWLVLPAGIRELQEINNQYQEQEISKLYRHLVYLVQEASKNISSSDIESAAKDILFGDLEQENKTQYSQEEITLDMKIQNILDKINNIVTTIMKSKSGIMRGAKLSKRVDHVARLVLSTGVELEPDEVGVPWFVLLKLYEPFVIHFLTKDDTFNIAQNYITSKFGELSVNNIKEFLTYVANNPENIPEDVKEQLINILEIIIKGQYDGVQKYVMVLRHPVENRDSILGLKPVIIKDNIHTVRLPAVLFSTQGADTCWDELVVCIDGKYMKLHIKDLEKYIKPLEIREFTREDGVKVKQILIKNNIEILSYDRIRKEFVIDRIIAWIKHENVKMNRIKIGDTYHIMSPRKETLLDEDDVLLKPTKDVIGKKVKNIYNYIDKLTDPKIKEFISYMDLQEDSTIYEVDETDITYGWDISTYETGTYVDKYGYVKKQCDGNNMDCHR